MSNVKKHDTPIVEMNVVLNASSENRNSRQVLPTPESPISNSLNNRSYVFFAISNQRTSTTGQLKMAEIVR